MREFNDLTRDRVLRSALEIFAERGFKEATVREICAKAGVNIASVNYYFRSKEALYAEVLAYAFREAEVRYPLLGGSEAAEPAEARLGRFIHNFLRRITDETNLGWHGKLIARELADPTPALDRVVESAIRPVFQSLREILPAILGPGWGASDIDRFIHGILGQCLVYRHSRSVTERLCPELIAGSEAIEQTAELIVRFTLAALHQLASDRRAAS